MSEKIDARSSGDGSTSTNDPAIGVVARSGDAEWVASTVVRARRSGYQPIVAGPVGTEWRTYADALDAIAVETDGGPAAGGDPTEALVAAARDRGFPGIVLYDQRDGRLDVEGSVRRLHETDDYAVGALTGPPVDAGRVLVGIPAYNEAATIGDVVAEGTAYADAVLVVDDGSDDRTAAVAETAGATVIEHDHNRGYGGALKTLFEQADRLGVDHLVVLDADSQHDPADVPDLVETQRRTGAEIVVGSRFVDGGATDAPLYRRAGLLVVNVLTNVGCGAVTPRQWVRDTQSGFRAYSREAVESLAADATIADRMDASTDILDHAVSRGYDVEEVGTTVSYDVEEANSRHPLTHGLTLVRNLGATLQRRRPLSTLGVGGFASWIVGLWVGQWTFLRFLETGALQTSTATVSAVLVLLGLLACVVAAVLHALSIHGE
ncbi:glycosyltransferase family 2 protein [Halobaculum lipolyticum]|uniref:Glycosyltransferase family 2 protein n=1 Tax=Halobaculum lipolyticum TaxID=3032001 RepID=A0ABD5WB68_9EURY|nr:glycosyltransferase family 2 protein [Halobaculum sp. DT31]